MLTVSPHVAAASPHMVNPILGLVSLTGSCPFQHNVNMGTGLDDDGGVLGIIQVLVSRVTCSLHTSMGRMICVCEYGAYASTYGWFEGGVICIVCQYIW